jgi:hypothetical protein
MMQVRLLEKDSTILRRGVNKMIKDKLIFRGGKVRATLRCAITGEITFQSGWSHNIIPTAGLNAILRRFGGVGAVANEGESTYGAVGSGSDTPQASDTQMHNEEERKLIGGASMDGNTLIVEVFFNENEANGVEITQFALFGEDASAAADSGTLMQYANFETSFTKTTIETLTVEVNVGNEDT